MKKYSADLIIGFYVEAENEEEAIKKIREEYEKDPLFYLDEALGDADLVNEDEKPNDTYSNFTGVAIDVKKIYEQLKNDNRKVIE